MCSTSQTVNRSVSPWVEVASDRIQYRHCGHAYIYSLGQEGVSRNWRHASFLHGLLSHIPETAWIRWTGKPESEHADRRINKLWVVVDLMEECVLTTFCLFHLPSPALVCRPVAPGHLAALGSVVWVWLRLCYNFAHLFCFWNQSIPSGTDRLIDRSHLIGRLTRNIPIVSLNLPGTDSLSERLYLSDLSIYL